MGWLQEVWTVGTERSVENIMAGMRGKSKTFISWVGGWLHFLLLATDK